MEKRNKRQQQTPAQRNLYFFEILSAPAVRSGPCHVVGWLVGWLSGKLSENCKKFQEAGHMFLTTCPYDFTRKASGQVSGTLSQEMIHIIFQNTFRTISGQLVRKSPGTLSRQLLEYFLGRVFRTSLPEISSGRVCRNSFPRHLSKR